MLDYYSYKKKYIHCDSQTLNDIDFIKNFLKNSNSTEKKKRQQILLKILKEYEILKEYDNPPIPILKINTLSHKDTNRDKVRKLLQDIRIYRRYIFRIICMIYIILI